MNGTKSIVSLGELADRWHAPLSIVEAAVRGLDVMPELTINGIAYFDEARLSELAVAVRNAITEHTRRRRR